MPYSRISANLREDFDLLNRYCTDISVYPLLKRKEERELAERVFMLQDTEAYEKLVLSNLRLVVKIALAYHSPHLNLFDLIQEGNLGLMRAVQKYNPHKKTRFSSYAFLWIRAYVLRHIMALWGTIKIGTTDSERKVFYGLNKARKQLYRAGTEPTPEELARILDVNEEIVRIMETRPSWGVPLDLVDGEAAEGQDTVEDIVASKERRDRIRQTIDDFKARLDQRDRFILEKRILADCPLTLKEIGKHFALSRERVRQLEAGLLKRLKTGVRQRVWEQRLKRRAAMQHIGTNQLS
ncbi:MAG TPA: RNA polymerase subunit sigma-70 [Deltaproteobacteria bacterium]|nr:RNA polymerase subunit sigma-70 [Deltaproteobacteria bacterium]